MLMTYFLLMLDYSPIGNEGAIPECNCTFIMLNSTMQCYANND